MNKIVVLFQPFTMYQNIIVYQNDNIIYSTSAPIDEVTQIVKGLSNEYEIYNVDLKGNQAYLQKYQAQLLDTYELLNVNII